MESSLLFGSTASLGSTTVDIVAQFRRMLLSLLVAFQRYYVCGKGSPPPLIKFPNRGPCEGLVTSDQHPVATFSWDAALAAVFHRGQMWF